MAAERRKYPRAPFSLPIKISDPEVDIVTETKNISGSGAYCSVNRSIPPMTKLKIILLVPIRKNNKKSLRKINCRGVVVRNEYIRNNGNHAYNIGIYFNEIKEADRKFIVSYVHNTLPKVSA